ncbi:MAG: hypothetical protein AAFZ18_21970 [Myxococcota bacterium]
MRLLSSLCAAAILAGCGDIGALQVDVIFPSEEVELSTRALRVVVRETPPDGTSGCDALWRDPLPGLRQTVEVTAFPNRNDVLAAAVSLDYPALNVFVYSHRGIRSVTRVDPDSGEEQLAFEEVGPAIAGGCVTRTIEDPNATARIEIALAPPP